MNTVGKDDVIRHLKQIRATLTHALTQPDISVTRFNAIREQLLPLDEELRKLGIDPEPTPQMGHAYVKLTRYQQRRRARASKFPSYEQRLREKRAQKWLDAQGADDENN